MHPQPTILPRREKFCLYCMGNVGDGVVPPKSLNWTHRNHQRIGVALADSPAGPWTRFDRPVVDISADNAAPDALMTSNPAVCRPSGWRLVDGLQSRRDERPSALRRSGRPPRPPPPTGPEGPWQKNLTPIFTKPGEHFAAEDPFIWHDGDR